ncbi:MAG: ATP-binding cassette domain-containing protein [Candidatus Omnitrophica bacterium]|nr:ATP-binding cassette domain-containing protein [Candidatus Omnitrophota bacterium]
MSDAVFQLSDIHFSYLGKYPALCGIDMTIEKGQKAVIIGANGSGKSTLLHMLDGLIFPNRGTITAFGRAMSEEVFSDQEFSRDFRKKVGFVFQNPDVQLFCPSVKEDILFGPLQLKEDKKEIEKRLERLIDILDIKELLDRSPHQLSVGEKRKVTIASTLIIDPEVLLLDEPTAGLDPLTTRHIMDFLINENKAGKTIITSTHDLHIVEEIADKVLVFSRDKKIVKSGSPEEILKDMALLQEHNLVHIHAHRHDGRTHVHPHEHPSHDHTH